MTKNGHFDVFLSHNSRDKSRAVELAKHLESRGIKVWLDIKELIPGRPWQEALEQIIQTTSSAAILVSEAGLGPWEIPEMRACVQEFVRRKIPVIPVLMPGAPSQPELPLFLQQFTWVDLREGITKHGLDLLIWGITGVKTLEIVRQLVVIRAQRQDAQEKSGQYIDHWGIASVKSRLHALSEVVAQTASEQAALAAAVYKQDLLSILIPVTFEMRWHRGYAAALEKMLDIPHGQKQLFDFVCAALPNPGITEGVLSAAAEDHERVTIMLDDHPVLTVSGFRLEERDSIIESVNLYGRLGVPSRAGMSLKDRIGEIPIRTAAPADPTAFCLFQNREALAPLIARHKMPGSKWLLADEEELSEIRLDIDSTQDSTRLTPTELRSQFVEDANIDAEEIFDARKASEALSRTSDRVQWHQILKSDVVRKLFGDLVDSDPDQVLRILQGASYESNK